MQISWTGVAIVLGGLGSIVALALWGGEGTTALQTAILAGLLGLLAPHPISRKASPEHPAEDEEE